MHVPTLQAEQRGKANQAVKIIAITESSASFSTSLSALDGIGPKRASALAELGLQTLGDLLEYFPRRYEYESAERAIGELVHDQIQIARGEVVAVDYVSRGRPRFEATLNDGTGQLALVWFNSAWMRSKVHPGQTLRVQGRVKSFRGLPQMSQAKWEEVSADAPAVSESKFRAVYPASASITSDVIERLATTRVPALAEAVDEWFSPALLKRHRLISRAQAYRQIHLPENLDQAQAARRRLSYDELMLLQIGLGLSKRLRDGRLTAPVLRFDRTLDERICARFPFTLTAAQQVAVWQIAGDLRSGRPMNRLLQGDVGSGKTIVALHAMLIAVANRMQAAILAPTEVLAEQHFFTLRRLLDGSAVSVELFTGRTKRGDRAAVDRLAAGQVQIAVGTQALIQRDTSFANLGLVVVDEQHRLGVKQRAVLKDKGLSPHYLVMTATPIPRTLALSYFADFDVTTIDELPPGRQAIKTSRLTRPQASVAYGLILKEVARGRRAFVVLPHVEEDGEDASKSVVAEFERLGKGPLKDAKLGMLHGRMSTDEKQAAMLAFRDGDVQVLVATTVIEVGIDVPTATVMVIDHADQFGLSQLHQLRGRVGRGSDVSYCVLLSDSQSDSANARLQALCDTTDGFAIAETDLQLRGPGEFFGTRQHGLPELKVADITAELELLADAKSDALELLAADPDLRSRENAHLRDALHAKFGETLALAQIG